MSVKKISNKQAFLLSLNIILATILLLVPNEVIREGGISAWLAVIIAGFVVVPLHYLVFKVSCHFSNKNIVQDCIEIFGSILGRLILIPFILLNIELTILIMYEGIGFIGFAMSGKEMLGFWIAVALLGGYLAYKGIETIIRVNLFGILIVLFSIIVIILASYNLVEIDRLKPLSLDFKRLLSGSILPAHWFLIIPNLFLIFKPFFKDRFKAIKVSLLGNFVSQFAIVILVVVTIGVFGSEIGGKLAYSFYALSSLSISGLEILIFVSWIMATIIKVGIYQFVSLYLLQEYFGLKSYKPLVTPFVILIISLGYFQSSIYCLRTLLIYIISSSVLVYEIPFLWLLIIAYLVKSKQ